MTDMLRDDPETGFLLAIAPVMKDIVDDIKAKLPPGTDFGLLICVPPTIDDPTSGRIIAACTDRNRVALAAGQWVIQTLNPR